jgi:hypothetical protein
MSIHSRWFAAAACALLPLAACGDSPEEVTEKFVTSIARGEASTALDLVSAESREAIGDARLRNNFTQAREDDDAGKVKVMENGEIVVSSDGRSASVQVVIPRGDGGEVSTVRLVKEDGEWKIDLSGEM